MAAIIEPGVDLFRRPALGGAGRLASSRGMVVALVGPDGVGKSRQTARLTSLFQEDYRCTAVYLGSGDGGWKLRRAARRYLRRWRSRPNRTDPEFNASLVAGRELGTSHSIFTGLSGVAIAIERYLTMRSAVRLAASGSIIISDRWPQNLQPGLFDGPLRVHPRASHPVRLLSRIEQSFYRRMEKYRPEVTIHLVSDFETSNARKPGDRTHAEFHERLLLMEEMRRRDPTIKVVDARNEFEEVTRDLSNWILLALAVTGASD